jgi:O-antigen/teichoic acid export membrane protein
MNDSEMSGESAPAATGGFLLKSATLLRAAASITRKQADRGRERYRRAGITASTSFLSKALTIAISFVSVPLTVHYLGPERYGVWLTISSLLMWMSLTDFGLTGNALVNLLSSAHGRDDRKAAREFVASAFWTLAALSALIGAICLLVFHWISWRSVFRVSEMVSARELSDACALTLVIFIASLPLSMLNSVYSAYQDGFLWNLWTIAGNGLSLLSLLIVTRFHGGLPLLISAVSGTRTLVGVANAFYMFFRHYPFLRPAPTAVRLSSVRSLFQLGGKYMITQLAGLGIYQSQPMIITQLLGPASVTIFVIAQKIITLPIDLAFIGTAPFISAFGEARARGDWAWIRDAFKRSIILSTLLSLIVQLIIALLAKRIIHLWAGAAAVPDTGLVLWLCAYTFIAAAGMPLGQALCGLERAGILAVSLSLCALAVVVLSLLWAHPWGLAGVAAAMASAKLLIAMPIQIREVWRVLSHRTPSVQKESVPLVA